MTQDEKKITHRNGNKTAYKISQNHQETNGKNNINTEKKNHSLVSLGKKTRTVTPPMLRVVACAAKCRASDCSLPFIPAESADPDEGRGRGSKGWGEKTKGKQDTTRDG